MKAFEFRLERVAEYRREQADLARNELERMTSMMDRLAAEGDEVQQRAVEMRTNTMRRADLNGQDLTALSSYEDHAARILRQIDAKKTELAKHIDKQRSVVREAERNVKLLDRLRDRKFQEWRAESDRELDALAADSHLARLAAAKTVSRLIARD